MAENAKCSSTLSRHLQTSAHGYRERSSLFRSLLLPQCAERQYWRSNRWWESFIYQYPGALMLLCSDRVSWLYPLLLQSSANYLYFRRTGLKFNILISKTIFLNLKKLSEAWQIINSVVFYSLHYFYSIFKTYLTMKKYRIKK